MTTPAKHDIEQASYNRWTLATMPKSMIVLAFALITIVLTYLKSPGWPGAWQAIGALITALGVYLVSNDRVPYAKTIVAVLGVAFSVLSPYLANGLHNLTPDQWMLALGALAAAFGVYAVPNQPPFTVATPYLADPSAHDVSTLAVDAPRASD